MSEHTTDAMDFGVAAEQILDAYDRARELSVEAFEWPGYLGRAHFTDEKLNPVATDAHGRLLSHGDDDVLLRWFLHRRLRDDDGGVHAVVIGMNPSVAQFLTCVCEGGDATARTILQSLRKTLKINGELTYAREITMLNLCPLVETKSSKVKAALDELAQVAYSAEDYAQVTVALLWKIIEEDYEEDTGPGGSGGIIIVPIWGSYNDREWKMPLTTIIVPGDLPPIPLYAATKAKEDGKIKVKDFPVHTGAIGVTPEDWYRVETQVCTQGGDTSFSSEPTMMMPH